MAADDDLRSVLDEAAAAVGPVWPLHGFVTANPLAGFESLPFEEAARAGERLFGGRAYPAAATIRRAWTAGQIDEHRLREGLRAAGFEGAPEALLEELAEQEARERVDGHTDDRDEVTETVDRVVAKWLAAFLDEGTAHWPMPGREQGFYAAVRTVAPHDHQLPDGDRMAELPAEPLEAVRTLLATSPRGRWGTIARTQFAALPGWTGYIRQRIADDGPWQRAAPISLAGYLAVRLAVADQLDVPVDLVGSPGKRALAAAGAEKSATSLAACWLAAWEGTYREELVDAVAEAGAAADSSEADARPAAQLVFCIDTRSEILRRHLEATGDYETHGYAGFFGIPMRYAPDGAEVTVDARPPILGAAHRIDERPRAEERAASERHARWSSVLDAGRGVIGSLKANAATAFAYVEAAGVGYGAALLARTLFPAGVGRAADRLATALPNEADFCEPQVDHQPAVGGGLPRGLTQEERVEYAAAAVEQMGWERFARVVAFVGHASRTTNNPFEASLDCGACAGNPGGPNARVLAAICNDEAVRAGLRDRGIEIPPETVFVAGEHTTTTDEVTLYTRDVPDSHAPALEQLRADLATARAGACAERAADMGAQGADGIAETARRAADWAEPRPEWGLAGNAALVIGPRALTAGLDLDGRAFLHSYDWTTDPDGSALAGIMTGPMVVTQWINAQYYFATVDNDVYGSGSKITQNPVGNVGVYQGNGGDLQWGLPRQSVMAADELAYHQPLRLAVLVHAPAGRVESVLAEHEAIATLVRNGWITVTAIDPEGDHRAIRSGIGASTEERAPSAVVGAAHAATGERPLAR